MEHTKHMKAILTLSSLTAAAALLVACGGSGGGGGGSVNPPTPIPTATSTAKTSPTPSPTPSAFAATASGTVVDYAADTPLSGVQVGLAPYTVGATPVPEATTNASGQFSFTTVPGTYLLVIGSNSPSATTATLHETVTLTAGTNVLTGATPQPLPDVTPVPSQTAGALRLMALNSVQQDCLSGMNAGRSAHSLPELVPDEYLEEDAIVWNDEEVAQATDTPSPLWGQNIVGPYGSYNYVDTEIGFSPCDSWTNTYSFTSGNPPYPSAINSANIWYGANVDAGYGAQLWMTDPR
jgi:hypothetical protein